MKDLKHYKQCQKQSDRSLHKQLKHQRRKNDFLYNERDTILM